MESHESLSEMMVSETPMLTGSSSSAKKKWQCVLCYMVGHHRARERAHYKACHQTQLYQFGITNPGSVVHGMVSAGGVWICPSCCTVAQAPQPPGARRDHTAMCLALYNRGIGDPAAWPHETTSLDGAPVVVSRDLNVGLGSRDGSFVPDVHDPSALDMGSSAAPSSTEVDKFVDTQVKRLRDDLQKAMSAWMDERLKLAKRQLYAFVRGHPEEAVGPYDSMESLFSASISGVKRRRGSGGDTDEESTSQRPRRSGTTME